MKHLTNEQLEGYALKLCEMLDRFVGDPKLGELVRIAWYDTKFLVARTPGSLGHHHAYEGGLLVHTLEVCDLALTASNHHPNADRTWLLTAALLHDVGKVYDYQVKGYFAGQDIPRRFLQVSKGENETIGWGLADYYKEIHHVQGSYGVMMHAAAQCGIPPHDKRLQAVGHAILAHHGPVPGWGSNIEPKSLEAVLLHQADYLSAHFGATKEKPC